MSKKTKAKKSRSKKPHLKLVKEPASTKMGFWLTGDLIARMRAHVDKNRSAPELMTINSFVRDALEASLSKAEKKKARAA